MKLTIQKSIENSKIVHTTCGALAYCPFLARNSIKVRISKAGKKNPGDITLIISAGKDGILNKEIEFLCKEIDRKGNLHVYFKNSALPDSCYQGMFLYDPLQDKTIHYAIYRKVLLQIQQLGEDTWQEDYPYTLATEEVEGERVSRTRKLLYINK